MPLSKAIAKKISESVELVGRVETARVFKISQETLRRYLRVNKEVKQENPFNPTGDLKRISEIYSPEELRAIAKGGRIIAGAEPVPIISFEGQHIKIGCITDTHIGHQRFDKNRLFQAFEAFRTHGVDFITHSGDVTEGLSHRPGHVFELSQIGYEQQKEEAVNLFSQWTDTPIYAVAGNHDIWYIKSNGANIVKDISKEVPNFKFLGFHEGDISLNGLAIMKLWHGEDASSYALSYRVQKIIESLSGGEKPSLFVCGHTHKYVKLFERNVHAVSVGCLEAQTQWMRMKRLAAHVGFTILDVWVNERGIAKISDTWFPFYT